MPATIPYSQTHDSHTGGSYNSSDRGSSSTSGKMVRGSRTGVFSGRAVGSYTNQHIDSHSMFAGRKKKGKILFFQLIITMNSIITYTLKLHFKIPVFSKALNHFETLIKYAFNCNLINLHVSPSRSKAFSVEIR